MRAYLYVIVATTFLTGCADLVSQKRGKVILENAAELDGKLMTQPAQLRNVYIKKPQGKDQPASYISCAEPAPDAALSDTFKLIAGVTQDVNSDVSSADAAAKAGKKLAVNADFQTSTTALELAGRTQLVLLARELLFRSCESASNGWLKPEEVKDTHKNVIAALEKMTAAAQKSSEARAEEAKTAGAALKLDAKLIGDTAARFEELSRSQCLVDYDECTQKAAGDGSKEKACKATFLTCAK